MLQRNSKPVVSVFHLIAFKSNRAWIKPTDKPARKCICTTQSITWKTLFQTCCYSLRFPQFIKQQENVNQQAGHAEREVWKISVYPGWWAKIQGLFLRVGKIKRPLQLQTGNHANVKEYIFEAQELNDQNNLCLPLKDCSKGGKRGGGKKRC